MKYRVAVALAVVFACLAASVQATAAEKDVLTEDFRMILMYAHTVAIVEVTGSTVEQEEMAWSPASWDEKVAFKNPSLLYGKVVPTAPAIVAANPYRGVKKPAPSLKPGAKVIVAWMERGGAALVPHSKAALLATRQALAPGWDVNMDLTCPACVTRGVWLVQDTGKCGTCGDKTASPAHKLCGKCGTLSGQCQLCQRTIGPATLHVTLWLGYIPPNSRRPEPVELKILPGRTPKLWVRAHNKAGPKMPPVPELPCMLDNLATCNNLFFLVEGPGIRGFEVVGFTAKIPMVEAPYKPLRKPAFAELELKLLPHRDDKAFKQPGIYTVRAVAGRLVSNARKVVVPMVPREPIRKP